MQVREKQGSGSRYKDFGGVLKVKLNLIQGFSEAVRKLQVERAYRQYQRETARETKATALQPMVVRRYKSGNQNC